MDNVQVLFPALVERLVEVHDSYFSGKESFLRKTSYRELKEYKRHNFIAGWRLRIKVMSCIFEINLMLDNRSPFSEPKIALVETKFFLKWPHVEEDGILCLRKPTDSLTHCIGTQLSSYYLKVAQILIEDCVEGRNKEDFVLEFESYWSHFCGNSKNMMNKGSFITSPVGPSRVIYSVKFKNSMVICDHPEEGVKWIRERYDVGRISEDDFEKSLFLWLDKALAPKDYPKTNYAVSKLVATHADENAENLIKELVPRKQGNTNIVFGFESGNGSALGGLILTEPVIIRPPSMKKIHTRFCGSTRPSKKCDLTVNKYFTVNGKADPYTIQRVDSEWIFQRGGSGIPVGIEDACVCIIGCGSLGAHVTKLLAYSGIRKFLLVDPDVLSMDNIGRHLLGGRDVGKFKADALKSHLQCHFPGLMSVQAKNKLWQDLMAETPEVITDCSLIISTVGDWDSEAALNHTFNVNAIFPPVVYGWTEPFGFAGHALLTMDMGGCFECGMDSYGNFNHALTRWDDTIIMKRPPACGVTYQPYGIIDIVPTQNMIARLCMDVLIGNIKRSQHHAWIGDMASLKRNKGSLQKGVKEYYGSIGEGQRIFTKDWRMDKTCRFNH